MTKSRKNKGLLLVVSGPSGVGKGTVCRELARRVSLFYSVSATTRAQREGELEGVHYFYKTQDEFQQMIQGHALLEWAQFCGNYYGTPKDAVFERLDRGETVLLEIDTKGALQVKAEYPQGVFVFLAPPSMQELERRIRGRGTETEEVILERLSKAGGEIRLMNEYDYIVINDTVEQAVEAISSILTAEQCRRERNQKFMEEVLGEL